MDLNLKELKVLKLAFIKTEIVKSEVTAELDIKRSSAWRLLKQLNEKGWLRKRGQKNWTRYEITPNGERALRDAFEN